jgi:hypothetical protein
MIQVTSAAVALAARIGCTLPEWLQASPRGRSREEDGTIRVLVETMAASS